MSADTRFAVEADAERLLWAAALALGVRTVASWQDWPMVADAAGVAAAALLALAVVGFALRLRRLFRRQRGEGSPGGSESVGEPGARGRWHGLGADESRSVVSQYGRRPLAPLYGARLGRRVYLVGRYGVHGSIRAGLVQDVRRPDLA